MEMRLLRTVSALRRCRKGNALILVATTAPLIIGAAAIGLDSIQLTLSKRQLQRAADSAALAGAYNVAQSKSAATAVTRDLEVNNVTGLSSAPVVQNGPASGAYAGNSKAVRVVLSLQKDVPFIGFFTGKPMSVQAEATAALVFSGQHCVISLENTAVTGIHFSGSTVVNLGCGVSSNSTSSQAVVADGASRVTATPISAVGTVPASASYVGTTQILSRSQRQADPFAAIPDPQLPSPCQPELTVQPTQTRTVSPGCYRGMTIHGTVNLLPGTYFIDGGALRFTATAVVNGTGVTFVMTSSNATSNPASIATLDMHGGAVLNLSAPDSGTYKGVLMYLDRRAPLNTVTINGNSASSFEGAFYMPSQQVTFVGNTGMRTRCIQFVARRMTFSGNSNIENQCPTNGGSRAFDAVTVRIVG
jgi:Flp pilus assembly protein TadG